MNPHISFHPCACASEFLKNTSFDVITFERFYAVEISITFVIFHSCNGPEIPHSCKLFYTANNNPIDGSQFISKPIEQTNRIFSGFLCVGLRRILQPKVELFNQMCKDIPKVADKEVKSISDVASMTVNQINEVMSYFIILVRGGKKLSSPVLFQLLRALEMKINQIRKDPVEFKELKFYKVTISSTKMTSKRRTLSESDRNLNIMNLWNIHQNANN